MAAWIQRYRGKKQRLKQALALLDPLEIEPLTAASWFEGSFVNVGYGQEKVIAASSRIQMPSVSN